MANSSDLAIEALDKMIARDRVWKKWKWFSMIAAIALMVAGLAVPYLVEPDLERLNRIFPDQPEVRYAVAFEKLKTYARVCAGYKAFFVVGLILQTLTLAYWKENPNLRILKELVRGPGFEDGQYTDRPEVQNSNATQS